MFKKQQGGVKHPVEKSAKVHLAVGSGSRPVTSKIAIATSAPAMPHTLDSRAPKSFLR
jgi:hypothetical protein